MLYLVFLFRCPLVIPKKMSIIFLNYNVDLLITMHEFANVSLFHVSVETFRCHAKELIHSEDAINKIAAILQLSFFSI